MSDILKTTSDSSVLNENCLVLIDELYNIELKSEECLIVLDDILKDIDFGLHDSIVLNYERIINNNFFSNESSDSIKLLIKEGIDNLNKKLQEAEYFLKEITQNLVKKQSNLDNLKHTFYNLSIDLKDANEENKMISDALETQHKHIFEMSEEIENLNIENCILKEENKANNNNIQNLQKEIKEKDNYIFDLTGKLQKRKLSKKTSLKSFSNLKDDYNSLKENHERLKTDIYEEEQKIQTINFIGQSEKIHKKSKSNLNVRLFNDNEAKLNEEGNKFLNMNSQKIIMYTIEIESMNKKLEEENFKKGKIIKDLEDELLDCNEINFEITKEIHLLKSEVLKLHEKNKDLSLDVEINTMFSPEKRNKLINESLFISPNRNKLMMNSLLLNDISFNNVNLYFILIRKKMKTVK